MSTNRSIKAIDSSSIHRITSGQVVIDLQTAVKELVENSLDAGATSIEVRFKQYGSKSIEVIDNGCGIDPGDYDNIAQKHHTSKLSSFSDLTVVRTFGFRGEALSSLCALCESVVLTTSTQPPMGVSLEMDASGRVRKQEKVARQRGTTVTLTNLFKPLPVRRKELERNAKREFGKALALLNAYALGPCCTRSCRGGQKDDEEAGSGVRLTVSNQVEKGPKQTSLRTPGILSTRASISSLWGPKALDNLVDLELDFIVEREKAALRRIVSKDDGPNIKIPVVVKGLVSKFSVGCGRTGTDRQFFYVNGRPCNMGKFQKAFNEVYRSFNANQSPFIVADFIIPTDSCDINVSPDKRSIFLHSEGNLIAALKRALEESFASSRATYDVTQTQRTLLLTQPPTRSHANSTSFSEEGERAGVGDSEDRGAEGDSVSGSGSIRSGRRNSHGQSVNVPTLSRPSRVSRHTPQPKDNPEPERSTSPVDIDLDVDADTAQASASSSLTLVPGEDAENIEGRTCSQQQKVVDEGCNMPLAMDVDSEPSIIDSNTERAVANAPSPITPGSTPTVVRTTAKEATMIMDTTSAAWNRQRLVGVDRGATEDAGPPRKKRRSDVEHVPEGGDSDVQELRGDREPLKRDDRIRKTKASTPPKDRERQNLRSRLAGFARSGSKVSTPDMDDSVVGNTTPDDEGVAEEDNEGVSAQGKKSGDGSKRSRKSVQDETLRNSGLGTVKQDDILYNSTDIDPGDPGDTSVVDNVHDSAVADLLDDDADEDLPDISLLNADTGAMTTPSYEEIISRPEVIRSSDGGNGNVSLRFDLSKITATWRQLRDKLLSEPLVRSPDVPSLVHKVLLDAGVSNIDGDDKAADALARVIEKEDFASMDIVGQFNLGFIVARRRKQVLSNEELGDEGRRETMDDLFIVDQHAADEKYNFETLQQTTVIKSQRLFRPQPLELTAADELLALENIDVLRQNGFGIDVDQDVASEQGTRLKLVAQPVSKGTVFDMKDLEELIHLMEDRPSGRMVRCSKARAMFAMRACRKSIMVGMPLTKNQMRSVVQHMGTMDQPWNCPHGRPTMRHLSDIAGTRPDKHFRKIDWSSF